jgi:hypothetical protein
MGVLRKWKLSIYEWIDDKSPNFKSILNKTVITWYILTISNDCTNNMGSDKLGVKLIEDT